MVRLSKGSFTNEWGFPHPHRFPETLTAIAFESQGMYDQAQDCYEQAMKRGRELHNIGPAPPSIIPEYKLWEEHWCKWVWSNNFCAIFRMK